MPRISILLLRPRIPKKVESKMNQQPTEYFISPSAKRTSIKQPTTKAIWLP